MQDGCTKHFIFFRHVLKQAYIIPTVIYPRKSTKLPAVMAASEIKALIDSVKTLSTALLLCYYTAQACALGK
jgi:hypothetical protein